MSEESLREEFIVNIANDGTVRNLPDTALVEAAAVMRGRDLKRSSMPERIDLDCPVTSNNGIARSTKTELLLGDDARHVTEWPHYSLSSPLSSPHTLFKQRLTFHPVFITFIPVLSYCRLDTKRGADDVCTKNARYGAAIRNHPQ